MPVQRRMHVLGAETVLGAIDVGTNAVRLILARPQPDGSLERLHEERDPIRPGEGLFRSGVMPKPVADRLLVTLRRYAALGRRHRAQVRAVATSAVREAKNRDDIVRRVREEAGVLLEVVSGMEEARLTCLGVLQGKPAQARSLCIDIGGGSTEVAVASGEHPTQMWSTALGAVRLTDLFDAGRDVSPKQVRLMREYAREVVEEAIPPRIPRATRHALGSSGTLRAVVGYAAAEGTAHVTPKQITRAVESLVALGAAGRRRRFDAGRADIIVAGAIIAEALATRLELATVTAVDRGLRDGILLELLRREESRLRDHSLADAAAEFGRRLRFDERHARQVARIALVLFDDLAPLHNLPAAVRPYLEMAAILHDVGQVVSYQKHHKHSYYLIQNADIPGIADRERELVARIARYHRRSAPELSHAGMTDLSGPEARVVRKLATLLRLADALDRSHHQPVRQLRAFGRAGAVLVRVASRAPLDLELWDATNEAPLFRRVFGRRLELQHVRGGRATG